jgi:hypothetical protein
LSTGRHCLVSDQLEVQSLSCHYGEGGEQQSNFASLHSLPAAGCSALPKLSALTTMWSIVTARVSSFLEGIARLLVWGSALPVGCQPRGQCSSPDGLTWRDCAGRPPAVDSKSGRISVLEAAREVEQILGRRAEDKESSTIFGCSPPIRASAPGPPRTVPVTARAIPIKAAKWPQPGLYV